ncbi:MAG: MBOAT family protein, partial [Clostridia bacterium]|nr:MBOAT family protein [Clostridia bacterium]
FFYGFGEPVYILIMVLSIFIDYFNGLFIEKYRHRKHLSRVFLILSITANLGLLGFFKYADFFIGNTNLFFGTDMALLSVALPIGISFFTFQTMSYSIDVYRGEVRAQKNLITFGTYVSMFPQLIAGPIVIYRDVEKQLEKRETDLPHLKDGIHRFILGLGKKVLLANSIGGLWEQVKMLPIEELTVATAWIGAAAFALQIYYDFSGYSDMAIGLGKLMGFDFLENFNYPFVSRSITEFWRRWHISLSKWFRNYLYFPLGGNRRGKWVTLRNIAVVWMLTGFWHGASWNYLLWGVYFAVVLILEKTFLGKILEKSGGILSRVYTLPVLLISFAVFALEDLSHLSGYLMVMLGRGAFADTFSMYLVDRYTLLFLLLVLFATPWPYRTYLQFLERKGHAGDVVSAIVLFALFTLSAAYIVDGAYNPFLYFRF